MLTARENAELTQVGPGTPMGALLRRYWHPVAAAVELHDDPAKEVRLLGEDLVLYQDRSGGIGLIDRFCAHRRVNLAYGIPEEHGLRCMYHGWLYDKTGQCIEQPFEETVRPEARFKDKIKMKGYPVQELGGLLFAYLGPQPAPLLPRWDLLVRENVYRHIGSAVVKANWLQTMENSLDPIHLEHLHGTYMEYVLRQAGGGQLTQNQEGFLRFFKRQHLKVGFEIFEHGIIKRRVLEGETENDEGWRTGHPILFPNILRLGGGLLEFQFRVPLDDQHTRNFWYGCFDPGPDVVLPPQTVVSLTEVPHQRADGRFVTDFVDAQDMLSWAATGLPTVDRQEESLGESDVGIILYRRLLKEQMGLVQDGADPMNVFRDPARNQYISVVEEKDFYSRTGTKGADAIKYPEAAWYGPVVEALRKVLAEV